MGSCCQFTFQTLHATSQDGLSLEFIAATADKECNIQDARGGGLCQGELNNLSNKYIYIIMFWMFGTFQVFFVIFY